MDINRVLSVYVVECVDITRSILNLAEFNSTMSPKLNEKVLKDKRKKLKETFERVIRMYVSI